MLLFLVDISMIIHIFFHKKTVDDPYDVSERCLHRLEKMREYFESKFPDVTCVAVFDDPLRMTFRKSMWKEFKSKRTKHETLTECENATREAVSGDQDWYSVSAPRSFEADDVIASMASQYPGKVIIHSADRDCHAMLEHGRVTILKRFDTPSPGAMPKVKFYTGDDLHNEFQFGPQHWAMYQTIIGGKDDVPGWDGVGPKTALRLIQSHYRVIDRLDMRDPSLDLNKRQRKGYGWFRRNFSTLYKVRTMFTELPWPDSVPIEIPEEAWEMCDELDGPTEGDAEDNSKPLAGDKEKVEDSAPRTQENLGF